MPPATVSRVAEHTSEAVNERIARQLAKHVGYFSQHPQQIDGRLAELDREWDIERMLEANAASLALIGTLLGAFADIRWLVLPAAVTAFLFQHAVQGWCPPLPILRRLGFRTEHEIAQERHALKALRGDYVRVATATDRATAALEAARL